MTDDAMKLALERARGCIKGLCARTPVRDVAETLAEIDAALASHGAEPAKGADARYRAFAWMTTLDMGPGKGSGPIFTTNKEIADQWREAGDVTELYVWVAAQDGCLQPGDCNWPGCACTNNAATKPQADVEELLRRLGEPIDSFEYCNDAGSKALVALLTDCRDYIRRASPSKAEGEQMNDKMLKASVDRFLAWKLPATFGPDCGISFDGRGKDARGFDKGWPIGTNLFTAEEARAMFEHCLAYASPAEGEVTTGEAEVPMNESCWLVEQTSNQDARRRFWNGKTFGVDALKGARYPDKDGADEVAFIINGRHGHELPHAHGRAEVCEHIFQCGPDLKAEFENASLRAKLDERDADAERWRQGVKDREFPICRDGVWMHVDRVTGRILNDSTLNGVIDAARQSAQAASQPSNPET